jgi:hypothetical protein
MSKRGYSLVEVMLTTGLLSMIMVGSVAVYLACYKTWFASDVSMQAAQKATMAVQRMVYGPYGTNGLRSALSTNIVSVVGSNNWSITYGTADGGWYRFSYVATNKALMFADFTGGNSNAAARVVSSKIVASSITPMAMTGLTVRVTAVATHRLASATNTLTSFIHYRN